MRSVMSSHCEAGCAMSSPLQGVLLVAERCRRPFQSRDPDVACVAAEMLRESINETQMG
jgi:hypothetical protein